MTPSRERPHSGIDAAFAVLAFRFLSFRIASIKQRELDAIATLPRNAELSLRTFNNMGTILYMAPERFIDAYRSSIASDIYSLGMVYLEITAVRKSSKSWSAPRKENSERLAPNLSDLEGNYARLGTILLSPDPTPTKMKNSPLFDFGT
jgi:serine/threonine protein kinase